MSCRNGAAQRLEHHRFYDGTSNRVKKISPSGSTTYYIGEHFEVKDTQQVKYIFAGNLRVAKVSNTDGTVYFHKDHLGSSAAMTSTSGAILEETNYMPFGEIREHTGLELSNYKFTDQEFDPETGLYYYGARYYDPVIGKFISPDSVVPDPYDPQTLNRYTYCRNNPIIYTDPSGHIFGIDDLIIAAATYIATNAAVIAEGAAIGAAIGGISAAATGGNILQGVLVGAVSGAVFAGVSGAVSSSVTSALEESAQMCSQAFYNAGKIGGAIAGGAAAGATAAVMTGGNIGQGALLGGLGGLAWGAVGAYFGNSWNPQRVAAHGLVGGGLAEAAGGDFEQGAVFALTAAVSRYAYNQVVGYDTVWEKGGEAVEKTFSTPPIFGANNIGTQGAPLNPNGLFNEGGIVSRLANHIPGINAVAGLHDVFQITLDQFGGNTLRNILNVPGMLPAAALTYTGLMSDTRAAIMYMNDLRRRER